MKITIPGKLMDLNEYIRINRGNKFLANKAKQENDETVLWCAKSQLRGIRIRGRAKINFTWFCDSKRLDPDNICFAKKFIMDGLVKAGVLENDGWKEVKGFTDTFMVDKKNPRIKVEISGDTNES